MNTINEIIPKNIYSTPQIVRIQLDYEISLALASPPYAPGWGQNLNAPKSLYNDPFKDQTA